MNILILFSQPWKVGGAETHVQAFIQGVYGEHEVSLAVNTGSDPVRLQELRERFPRLTILTIQARGINIFRWAADIVKLAKLLKSQNIQIISAQQRTAGLWSWILRKLTGVPFVVTMHDSWHRAMGKRYYGALFDRMIVVSSSLAERLRSDFAMAPDKIVQIHNGIDFSRFIPLDQQQARLKLGLDLTCKLILHVSRLSSIKGAVALAILDSIPRLADYCQTAKLVIIGEGPLRAELEQRALAVNKKYDNIVEIKDFTTDIVCWYSAADLIIGEGRVAIEALACLKPVVAIRNSEFFFGAVTADNIHSAMAVNFDGRNFPVKPELLIREIAKGWQLTADRRAEIQQAIQQQMSIPVMTGQYLQVFRKTLAPGGNSVKNESC